MAPFRGLLHDLEREGIDIAIRWGKGDWTDMRIEPLFSCPAFATAAPVVAVQIERMGLERTLQQTTLLEDRDGSTAWAEWLAEAGLPNLIHLVSLTIPDPNARVQAVLDGQGIAINDHLVQPEIDAGTLCRISELEMPNYGYHLAIPADALSNPNVAALVEWLKSSSEPDSSV